ncbi:unnamed protein product [Rhizophagus irregularis]|nr:unnamed protein product [Rhizophagus irregularis]CAB5370682.1 unnamed protein product [Rhizophagus irregularis]
MFRKSFLTVTIGDLGEPPKLCPDCKETSDCVKIFSSKLNKIEETVNNFYTNLPKKNIQQISTFNAKFTLNDVPCEVDYDLSNFTLENLQKLVILNSERFQSLEDVEEAEGIEDLEYIEDGYLLFPLLLSQFCVIKITNSLK